mmetsp:Transcript_74370/g.131355  ORF Transcript_74370/g.131355 Transcript_74370/m.131355 type:complete len:137 (-) Transcript_74370:973-1383(-)
MRVGGPDLRGRAYTDSTMGSLGEHHLSNARVMHRVATPSLRVHLVVHFPASYGMMASPVALEALKSSVTPEDVLFAACSEESGAFLKLVVLVGKQEVPGVLLTQEWVGMCGSFSHLWSGSFLKLAAVCPCILYSPI